MNNTEIGAFLERPLVATLATVNPVGVPHAVPVWYRFDGSVFTIWTDASRRWVKNAVRRPDVTIVVAEHERPFSAVVARGRAEVTTDGPDADEEIRRITARYIEAAQVDAYIAQWSGLRTIVRITPKDIRAWGRGY